MSRRIISSISTAARHVSSANTSITNSLRSFSVGCPACESTMTTMRLGSSRFMTSTSSPLAPTLERTPMQSPSTHQVPPLPGTSPTPQVTKSKARVVKPRKAAITLSSTAVDRIRSLLDSPEPKLIRVGVRNKGCAGMSYHLEYVDKADRFDEVVEQDGVKVIIDSKALFSIIGSTMDWQEDALQAKFVFNNPNIKDACGCGESFIV